MPQCQQGPQPWLSTSTLFLQVPPNPPTIVVIISCFSGRDNSILAPFPPTPDMKKNKVDSVLEIYLVLPMYEHLLYYSTSNTDFLDSSDGKESVCNAGDTSLIPGLGRCAREGIGCPLQYSDLENSMDCTVHVVEKSQTRLSHFHSFTHWLCTSE